MMRSVAVVGDEEFTLGFQLAGVVKAFVLKDQPDRTIRELMTNKEIGLIIIQESQLARLSEELREQAADSIEPVFLTITEEDTNEEMRKLIKKSIGVDLWNK
jgi:V/A-type H+/Na+-transporting ATPase subunit F